MHPVLSCILLAFLTLIVRLVWLGMVPMAEAPDEITHLWVIKFIQTYMRLPTGQEVLSAGPVAVYGSIPQFGYLPHLAALRVLPNFPEIIAARLASLLMSVVTVLLARGIAMRIFNGRPLLQWSLPLVLIFHPQFVFVGSYVNNDVTSCALASAILLLLVDSLLSGLKYWRSLLIGVLTGWLALTKYSGYGIICCVGVFLLVSGFLHRARLKQILAHLTLTLGVAGGLSAWWFVRNYHQFHGDITGSRTLLKTWTEAYHRKVDATGGPLIGVLGQSRWWRMIFFSFWGWFGYMTRSLPRLVYYMYGVFVGLAFLGGVKAWCSRQLGKTTNVLSFTDKHGRVRNEGVNSAIWALMLVSVAINFAATVYGTASGVSGPQGRYLFSSEIPLMALMLAGLHNLSDRIGKYAVVSFVSYNVGCYLYATWYLHSLYGFSAFALH